MDEDIDLASSPGQQALTVSVPLPTSAATITIQKHIRALEAEYGVDLNMPRVPGGEAVLEVIGQSSYAVLAAEVALRELASDAAALAAFEARMQQQAETKLHVFVDYSNVSISASKGAKVVMGEALMKVVVGSREARQKVVAGSVTSDAAGEALKREWSALGFHTHFPTRPAGMGEGAMSIDETLIGPALAAISCTYPAGQRHKLVLVTGDGNANKGMGVSFLELADKALQKGWEVEVWSWTNALSGKYKTYAATYPGIFQLYHLDVHKAAFCRASTQPQPMPQQANQRKRKQQHHQQHQYGRNKKQKRWQDTSNNQQHLQAPDAPGPSFHAPNMMGQRFRSAPSQQQQPQQPQQQPQPQPPQQQPQPLPPQQQPQPQPQLPVLPPPPPPPACCPMCQQTCRLWQLDCGHRSCKTCGDKVIDAPRSRCPVCKQEVDMLFPCAKQ